MIRFDDVTFSYGGDLTLPAVADVSFQVSPGQMVAVLGANGSGKSTLARLANGLLLPDDGAITVEGIDTRDHEHDIEVRSAVALVFQDPDDQIVATSVEDDVAFGPENLGLPRREIRDRVDAALTDTGLVGLERREPHLLSGGQKQRLAIAGALAMHPRYLVLDEPMSMIDAEGRRQVLEVLGRVRQVGQAIVLITHDLVEAMAADKVIVLSAGRVAFAGTPAGLLGEGARFEEWGLEMSPLLQLAEQLRVEGIPVPAGSYDVETVAGAVLEASCP